MCAARSAITSAYRFRRRPRALPAGLMAILAGLLVLATAVPAHAAATRPFLYIANGIGNNVTVYDISANATAATIPAGTQPQGAAASTDGTTVYIANAIGGISVISTATNTVTATIADGSFPIGLALSPDGHVLYASNETGTVSVIDTATNTVAATIPLDTGAFDVAVPKGNVASGLRCHTSIYAKAGSRKNPLIISGSRWRRSSARVAIPNSSDPRWMPARLMSSCFTFFQTHSSGLSSGE
jgi:YVTN family beta-propeller protein